MERIGLVGLGVMGLPMARNLLKAGFPLSVHDQVPGRAESLITLGATVAASARAVAAASDIFVSMVPGSAEVEAVFFGPGGVAEAARPDLLAVDMSTISPDVTRAVAARCAAAGFRAVDAPVSGGEGGAIDGTLTIMVGGADADVARAMPMLQAVGRTIIHIGPNGAGQACKLANQIALAINNLSVAESLTFAASQGLDLQKVREVIANGTGSSHAMKVFAPKILAGDFKPGFTIDLMQKDLRLALEAGDRAQLPLQATALAHQLYNSLQRLGEGRSAHIGLIRVLEAMTGLEVRASAQSSEKNAKEST